jgi:Short C-terminal domain
MSAQTESRAPLWRLILARIFVVLGALILAIVIIAGYVNWQVFDTDTFEETAGALIEDDEVRNQVAAATVDRLFANVDVQAELAEQLPPNLQRLAGPIAGASRELADRGAQRLLERPRVQALFRESLVRTQRQLERVLDDDLTAVQTEGGYVVLNLRPIVIQLGERVAIVSNLADRLPPDAGRIRIMQATELERAQDVTQTFKSLASWLWVVPLLLWAAAIWLARGRRRLEVRAIAIGIVAAGLLVLVARALAGRYVVDELATEPSVETAADHAWSILTDLLRDGAWSAIAIGLVALLGVWLSGQTASGTAARRYLAPVLARPLLTYGILATLFLLFVWWGPFAQARRPLWLVVTAVLLVIGVEVFRRLTAREFPDAAETSPGELLPARLRPGSRAAPPAATAPPSSTTDELERLARLRAEGVLTDEELAAAKARVLAP